MSLSVDSPDALMIPRDASEDSEFVSIVTQTWSRDSHDLFDYETPQTEVNQFRLLGGSLDLFRDGNKVIAVNQGSVPPIGLEYLASVYLDKCANSFRVSQKEGRPSKKIWSVVKSNWSGGVRLREGMTLKLGRFKLRVRQICTSADDSDDMTSCSSYGSRQQKAPSDREDRTLFCPDLRLDNSSLVSSLDTGDAQQDPSIAHLQCRICLCEGPADDDPLICPCECAGSIRYVHSRCIGKWLSGRLGVEQFNGSVFFFRPLACELCHSIYPSYYDDKGIPTPLATLPETKMPFIVFENLGGSPAVPGWHGDSSNTNPEGLHVVRLDQSGTLVKIGRGHECQMRISDVSISRLHASVRVDADGAVYLEDQKSKFGTLVEVEHSSRGCISMPSRTSLCIQSGRTLISLSFGQVSGSDRDTVNDTDIFEDPSDELSDIIRPNTH
jgi:hypothetical protein